MIFGGIFINFKNNMLFYLFFGGKILIIKIGGLGLGKENLQTN